MAAAAISLASTAQAQEFLKDKTLTFIVGYSPGGTYDQYTRLIARHINKHVSGNPTRIVENMPGAGGIIAANHLYNRVKPDGLTIAAWASPLILQHVMGNEATKFDGRKVGWVGIPGPYDTACHFNRESGIRTVDDWFASKRPLKIASIGPGPRPASRHGRRLQGRRRGASRG
jgi:tripartite-type tricarboxylate transporter receptor subunit TctC